MGRTVANPFAEPTRGSGTIIFDFIARLTVIALTIVITPGVKVTNTISLVLVVVAIVVAGWLLRPVFMRVAASSAGSAPCCSPFRQRRRPRARPLAHPRRRRRRLLSWLFAAWMYGFAMAALTGSSASTASDYLTVHAMRMGGGGRRPGRRGATAAGAPEERMNPASSSCSSTVCRLPCWRTRSAPATSPRSAAGCARAATRWTEWTARVPVHHAR